MRTRTDARGLTCGEVGLDKHLSRGHEVGVCVRVETRCFDHKVHDRGRATTGEKLVGGRRASALVCGIGVGGVPVDVATRGETTDEDDGAIGECFRGRVPAHLLHGEHGGVVEPLTICGGQVGGGARVEYADGLSAVIVAVDAIVAGGGRGART